MDIMDDIQVQQHHISQVNPSTIKQHTTLTVPQPSPNIPLPIHPTNTQPPHSPAQQPSS